jgi:hypothetical protein
MWDVTSTHMCDGAKALRAEAAAAFATASAAAPLTCSVCFDSFSDHNMHSRV